MTTAAHHIPASSTVPHDSRHWQEYAVCQRADPELFAPAGSPTGAHLIQLQLTAIGHCARCPVIAACGADADTHIYEGLWGGAHRHLDHTSGDYVAIRLVPEAPKTRRPRKERRR